MDPAPDRVASALDDDGRDTDDDDSRSSSCSSGKSADPNSDQDSTDGEDQLLPERPEPWNVSDEDGEHLASLLLGS